MPLSRYFRGKGEKVMAAMKKEYGDKKGEEVFYATANKKKPKRRVKKKAKRKVKRRKHREMKRSR